MPLPEPLIEWGRRGGISHYCAPETFFIDAGDRGAKGTVLILHGFPSSSFDWRHVFSALEEEFRVILLDFPGFGFSARPRDYSYSLFEQADVVEMLLHWLGITRAHIVSHDMGTSVACELLTRRDRDLLHFEPESLVLMNGSVHIEMARLTLSQRLLLSPFHGLFTRYASYPVFRAQLQRILGKPLQEIEYEAMWAMINHGGRDILAKTIGYVRERRRFRERWIRPLGNLDLPARVIWGPEDPVAVPGIAERLAGEIPHAELEWLDGLGHYPMIEDPEATTAALLRFLRKAVLTAA